MDSPAKGSTRIFRWLGFLKLNPKASRSVNQLMLKEIPEPTKTSPQLERGVRCKRLEKVGLGGRPLMKFLKEWISILAGLKLVGLLPLVCCAAVSLGQTRSSKPETRDHLSRAAYGLGQ